MNEHIPSLAAVPALPQDLDEAIAWVDAHPIPSVIAAALALIAGTLAYRIGRRLLRGASRTIREASRTARRAASGRPSEDLLTVVAASIATGVSAQGMWRFSGDVLGFDGPLQVGLFAFLEVAMVTSAVRARRNMRENYSAGIDGLAVWAMTCLSAVLSAMDAASFAEAVFRLAAPLVAAWLWERGMAIERRKITGRKRIHWRLTPERILVRLGLAETADRTAEQVDTQRRLTRIALAADDAHQLREAGASERKQRKAHTRLRRAFTAAATHTGLARDCEQQEVLQREVAALRSMEQLLDIPAASAWTPVEEPAGEVEPAEMLPEAREAIAAYKGWQPKLLPFPLTPPHTPATRPEDRLVSTAVSASVGVNGTPVNGHTLTPPHTAPDPATVTLPTQPVSEPVSVGEPETWPTRDGDVLTITHTDDSTGSEQPREGDDEERDERGRPNDQDNRRAEEWIRTRCRGRNGIGKRPTWSEVADRYGFSDGWGGKRVRAVQERMTGQGYTFCDDGTVYAPNKPLAEPLTTDDGSGERDEEKA
ncbi:hypothetical protein [Sphaerimonospora thailandensis]|uniref:DUF2637 domain-containing protein n=1 Tax=Sphaerimonospora thailandensis TaxID=795644 RepID=A0A8J3R9R6_9ACTN|nr:hypothetical protein [Sphaerimonospora thailandensis]GIH70371.1 hypothetical protein Mth01_26240 [Sphaerimonospora thailandensis]